MWVHVGNTDPTHKTQLFSVRHVTENRQIKWHNTMRPLKTTSNQWKYESQTTQFLHKMGFQRTPVHIQRHFHGWPTMLVKVGNTDPSASFINAPVDSYWYSCTMLLFSSSEVIKSILIMRCRMPTKHHLTLCFQKDFFCYITRFTFWLLCIRQLPHNAIIKQTFHMPTSVWWTNWLKSLSQNLYTTSIYSHHQIHFLTYTVQVILWTKYLINPSPRQPITNWNNQDTLFTSFQRIILWNVWWTALPGSHQNSMLIGISVSMSHKYSYNVFHVYILLVHCLVIVSCTR